MNASAHYMKIVTWSEEDQCFVGQCPDIIGPCCHGDNEEAVYSELCTIVREWSQLQNSNKIGFIARKSE